MIDIKFLRENPDIVKENIRKKFQDEKLGLVDEVIVLDAESRKTQQEADDLRANRNKISKEIGALMGQGKKEEAEQKKAEVAAGAKRLAELEEKEKELDAKLPQFLAMENTMEVRQKEAELYRKMRNKIAHGDFIAFEELVETYAREFMDGHFNFDYSEYSRKNWVILQVCRKLDDAVRELIHMMFVDRSKLESIKSI